MQALPLRAVQPLRCVACIAGRATPKIPAVEAFYFTSSVWLENEQVRGFCVLDVGRVVDPPHHEYRHYSGFAPNLIHGDAAVLKVQHWLQATRVKEADLPRLAAKAGTESRTFLRRFEKVPRLTTTDCIQRVRRTKARELLQFGILTIDQFAWDVGYGDTSASRKVFARIPDLWPAE